MVMLNTPILLTPIIEKDLGMVETSKGRLNVEAKSTSLGQVPSVSKLYLVIYPRFSGARCSKSRVRVFQKSRARFNLSCDVPNCHVMFQCSKFWRSTGSDERVSRGTFFSMRGGKRKEKG